MLDDRDSTVASAAWSPSLPGPGPYSSRAPSPAHFPVALLEPLQESDGAALPACALELLMPAAPGDEAECRITEGRIIQTLLY